MAEEVAQRVADAQQRALNEKKLTEEEAQRERKRLCREIEYEKKRVMGTYRCAAYTPLSVVSGAPCLEPELKK